MGEGEAMVTAGVVLGRATREGYDRITPVAEHEGCNKQKAIDLTCRRLALDTVS